MSGKDKTMADGPERDAALAGEYVLGVLPLAERRAAEARIAVDPAFAALVVRWQRDLESLDAHFEPVKPPSGLEDKINERLFGPPVRATSTGLWGSLAFWRGLAFASILAAAGLGFVAAGLVPGAAPDDEAPLVARLTADGAAIGLVAEYDPQTRAMTVVPAAFAPEGARSLELWLVPGEGPAISMGVVPEDGGRFTIDAALGARIDAGALIAVSLEPPGGSPTGVATGPVLVTGKLAAR